MAEMEEAEKAWPHSSGDGLHLPGRDPLHIHLGQRCHQRLLGALVAFEELGRKPSVAVLRHPQFELADAGHKSAGVMARAVAEPRGRAFPFSAPSASVISASSISCITARTISRSPSGLLEKMLVDAGYRGLSFPFGHGGVPPEMVTRHHQPVMTASLFQRFCRTFNTLLVPVLSPS